MSIRAWWRRLLGGEVAMAASAPRFSDEGSAGFGVGRHIVCSTTSGPGRTPRESRDPAWRQALEAWLAWNAAYENVTARAYQAGEDAAQLETLMDDMDQLRRQAVEKSHHLLD